MTNYQKAIKVRKVCEIYKECTREDSCPYNDKCYKSNILIFSPENYDIERVAKAIREEKWKVK